MQRPRRGMRSAIMLALALVAPSTALTAVHGRADVPAVTMRISAGYPGVSAHAGEWIPVSLTLRAGFGDIDAQAEVTATGLSAPQQNGFGSSSGVTQCVSIPGGGTACSSSGGGGGSSGPIGPPGQNPGSAAGITYRLPVVMAAGTTKRFTLYTIASGTGVSVRIVHGGNVLAEQSASTSISFSNATAHVAVVSDTPGALSSLAAVQLFNSARVEPVVLAPSALPPTGVALSAFDVVLIDGASTSSLTSDQRQALRDLVHGGGALVIAGGNSAQANVAGLSQDLLPADIGALVTVPGLPHFAAQAGAPASVSALTAATLSPARGGRVSVRDGDLALVVEADHGAGRVVQLAVDPRVEPLASWSGTVTLLRQSLTRAQRAAPALAVAGPSQGLQVRPVPLGWADSLSQAVTNMPGLDLPSALVIGLLLIAYLVLIGPVNYLVLRRLHRRDLMWVTVPVLAVLGTLTAYVTGLGIRGSGVVLSEVRVVTVSPGDGRALVETYAATFSPRGGNATIGVGSATEIAGLGGLASGTGAIVAIPGQPPLIQLEGTSTASLYGFSAAGYQAVAGHVLADVHLRNGHLRGTVTNHLGVALTDVQIVSEQAVASLPAVPDGGAITVDVSATGQTGNGNGNGKGGFQGPMGYTPNLSPAERDAARRQDVVNALTSGLGGGTGGAALGAEAVIVAMADRPVVASEQGGAVTGHILDAVVVPLADTSATPTLSPIGEIVDQVANAVDSTSSDSIVQYRVQGLRPGFHLDATSATQSSNCPPGAPFGAVCGPTGPGQSPGGGTAQPLTCEAYNQAAGTWDRIPLSSTNIADVADATPYVSSDGLLLLRLRAGYGGLPVLRVTTAGSA